MLTTTNLRALLAGAFAAALLLTVPLALAQEATAQATVSASDSTAAATAAPPGGGLLFLLIGLGAILLVALIWLVRERAGTNPQAE